MGGMNGEARRRNILGRIGGAPVTATELSALFGVSRQVIVQDVALLRAEGAQIVSTNRGYVAGAQKRCTRVFKVRHSDEETRAELFAVVDAGGCVEDVSVHHEIYGTLRASMGIDSRLKAEAFIAQIEGGKSALLKNVTQSYHCHTVSAESEAVLSLIEKKLAELGFLAAEGEGEKKE